MSRAGWYFFQPGPQIWAKQPSEVLLVVVQSFKYFLQLCKCNIVSNEILVKDFPKTCPVVEFKYT